MRLFLLFIVLFLIGIFGMGVRVHPSALTTYFESRDYSGYQKLVLKNGNFFIGKVVQKNDLSVTFKMNTATMDFSNSEIADLRDLGPEEIKTGAYDDMLFEKKQKALITYDASRSIFPTLKIPEGGEDESGTGGGSFFPDLDPGSRIKTAQVVKDRVLKTRTKIAKRYEDAGVAQDK